MPITQSRMIALISAGRDYQQAATQMRATIEEHHAAALAGQETWEEALQIVFMYTNLKMLLTEVMTSPAILEVEYSHFRTNSSRNRAAAKRAADHRRDLGVLAGLGYRAKPEPRTTAPTQIKRQETLISPTVAMDEAVAATAQPVFVPEGTWAARVPGQTDEVESNSELSLDTTEGETVVVKPEAELPPARPELDAMIEAAVRKVEADAIIIESNKMPPVK